MQHLCAGTDGGLTRSWMVESHHYPWSPGNTVSITLSGPWNTFIDPLPGGFDFFPNIDQGWQGHIEQTTVDEAQP